MEGGCIEIRRLWSFNEIRKIFGLEPAQNDTFKKMWSLNEIKEIGGLDLEELDTSRRMWDLKELLDLSQLVDPVDPEEPVDPEYEDYALNIYKKSNLENIFAVAWEHSLTVDPSEIERNSTSSTQYGTLQYPNGEYNGVIIPNSVTSIGQRAFINWTANNKPLVIPNSVTSIGFAAFRSWTANNQPLVIPNSVTSIGDLVFDGWSNVPYIEMKSETPPTLSATTAFANQNNAPIYVPDGSVDDYKNATNWSAHASRIFPISEK